MARSSFYARRGAAKTRAARQAADDALVHEITAVHVASRGPAASRASMPNCAAWDGA